MQTTNNLTGIQRPIPMNLSGLGENISNAYKITLLKQHIFKYFLLPLYSEQWETLYNSHIFIDQTISRLQVYYKMYKTDDLWGFIELLRILKIAMDQHQASDQTPVALDKNNIVQMVYRTTKIRLMPEYELYHMLVGKPNLPNHECYQEDILQDIRQFMVRDRVQFEQIQTYILSKYKP